MRFKYFIFFLFTLRAPTSNGLSLFEYPTPSDATAKAHFDDVIDSLHKVGGVTDELYPDWWGNKFLPSALSETIPSCIKAIILYKPPIGFVSVFILLDLLLSRNKKLAASFLSVKDDQERAVRKRKRKYMGRNLHLDADDRKLMIGLGGVEAVRAELCVAALSDYTKEPGSSPGIDGNSYHSNPNFFLSDPSTTSYYATSASDALIIKLLPRSSYEHYVEQTIEPIVRLQSLFKPDNRLYLRRSHRDDAVLLDLLLMAARLAEIRTVDALLRILREQLLISAVRLSKKERYRQWRLEWYDNGLGRFWKRWFRQMMKGKTFEDDRRNLQLTTAAVKRETERLGEVQMLLLQRPAELSETSLLMASSFTSDELESGCIEYLDPRSTRRFCAGDILPNGAKEALQSAYSSKNTAARDRSKSESNNLRDWTTAAEKWTARARRLVNELVVETMKDVFQPADLAEKDRKTTVGYDLEILAKWSTYNKSDAEGWQTALMLSSNLSKPRLMREKKYLPTANDLQSLLKKYDIFGIPSSFVKILGAIFMHELFKPIWMDIVGTLRLFASTLWGILEFRFWNPLKVIILDLLNRRPRLLDPFALVDEEKSLDNMLRDLGLGDGTKESRAKALVEAADMYEKELATGAIKNIFRGDMVRLLLIQVQQMKTGVLQAMGSIDDLMDSNRLNVQLLAGIPAVLLVTLGTKLFLSAMYSLKSRDFVGISNAKTELANLLSEMERDLLLASYEEDAFADGLNKENDYSSSPRTIKLKPNELGKDCDSVHSSMQDLLIQGQLTTGRQIALLHLIHAKHNDLMKSL